MFVNDYVENNEHSDKFMLEELENRDACNEPLFVLMLFFMGSGVLFIFLCLISFIFGLFKSF